MSERVTAIGEATSLADRKRRAGERLVIGLEGLAVDDDLRRLVAEVQPAGFVLFSRNVAEPAQVLELNRELASLCSPHFPPLLAVDQEGGRVQRVREPATRWPPMRAVGRADTYTERVAKAMAVELRAMGFNLNFAPVADVDSNPDNPIIGDRSFGRESQTVARHVVTFLRAHQAEGIICCAKHFPGHGDTALDSHVALPWVERDEPDLRHIELPPFRAAIEAGVATVMTSHVMYPAWDEEVPATLSRRIIHGILRTEMGFDGVVFSDDLEMKAVHGRYGVPTIVERATRATVDILLCCRDPTLQLEAFTELVRGQERDPTFEDLCRDACTRVMRLREQFFRNETMQPDLETLGCGKHRDLALEVAERGAG